MRTCLSFSVTNAPSVRFSITCMSKKDYQSIGRAFLLSLLITAMPALVLRLLILQS